MSEFLPASRVTRIKASASVAAAARVRELKAEGVQIIDLTVGEPDFDTPDHIKAAAVEAINRGETKYTSVTGTPELQAAILGKIERDTGHSYGANQLTIGGGAKQVLYVALMASLNAGDEVIVPAPYWVSYPDMVLANDGTPVIVETTEKEGFKLTPGALAKAITPKTKWLILNAPSNPTGAVYSREELQAIGAVLEENPHVFVLTDEIYDEVYFGQGRVTSLVTAAPALKDRILLVNGVSKAYAMTGWRLGYGVGPAPLIAAMNKLQSQTSSCPSSISQAAAAAALNGDQSFVRDSVEVYRKRRDAAVEGLNAINGLSVAPAEGAFYAYVNCAGVIGKTAPDGRVIANDQDFTLYLLDAARVAVIQGSAYGLGPYFRISFATSLETINAGVDSIRDAVNALN
ncbi:MULTISPECIES: aspartate transaminase [Paenarthrobacter]|jgi:aspartate aminotransferase|uniref:aspartate transaminase n=1 Tax=Paenarthrobacter TaxID=1742992 RepID=UPI001409444E|nr:MULTISPECIES: aspartate transaminase [Paenarthrobacter]MCX8454508.1 aspartate transaminase [Paenarthrobacter ureafaciens]MCY0974257.1 aspartate transaminase [Paenarthrobacter ureafaciens]QOT15426.1 aspartate transaminase [Paenarthrobacter sp. YJN-5]QQQ62102.1 aspartate transaminase [Paenarthrobacter ureafaciens]UOD81072.1 aspartate transaminase [Paenarthrobacter ureafaciens]